MDLLHWIERIFAQYGYFVLLVGLPLDFIILPIPPAQTTIIITGYLVSRNILFWLPALITAFLGSIIGITAIYMIGYKAGKPILSRFITRKHKQSAIMQKAQQWHDRYGHKVLLFSFFIPGIRQFYGYYMGITRVSYRTFALYGYTGAAIWVLFSFMVGYSFAEQWQAVIKFVEENISIISSGLIVTVLAIFTYKYRVQFIRFVRNIASKEVQLKWPKFLRFFRAKDRD